ncbi:hypothetical protein BDY19DRAFT_1056546 [Irpex rosettiformis]|uniref:Uncharacterized protein n=1 Tax=Irpex rosettiformis TaxID=378272 RepID=A0ACB8U593_9APHY|nr:hypothetical protein BDY19DRAFT_1056546 [Irpex rosettiformis]
MDINLKVQIVPFSYFKDYLLPPLHNQLDIATVVNGLRETKDIYKLEHDSTENSQSRWSLFPVDPADTYDFNEDRVFGPFPLLADAIAKQAKSLFHELGVDPEPEQTVTFLCNPTMAPVSTSRHSASKPDGYGVLVERSVDHIDEKTEAPHWDDIVVPGEMKKCGRAEDFNHNNAKLLWSLRHAMRETVYRRFIFGYTIENTQMRLWFCSRSDIIASDAFNFIMDHETVVHFFLSIMFAQKSRLGYDPTISVAKRAKDQRSTKYGIKVRGKDGRESTYIMEEVVANMSSGTLQGRSTRVWRGKKADANGHSTGHNMVIKDCWIDSSREREGDFLAEIFEAAKKSPNPEHLPRIQKHFLTVVQHGDVFIDGEQDNTFGLLRGDADFPEPKRVLTLRCSSETREMINPPTGLVRVDQATIDWLHHLQLHHDKFHYRIVFDSEEDCDPIDKLTSVRGIWYALTGALTGLATLHQLGFIHRDISPGNILVGCGIPGSVKGGTGKIIDLEFCKRIDDDKPVHQRRTGTPYFIPVEVEKQAYKFGPMLQTDPEASELGSSELEFLGEDEDDPSSDMSTNSLRSASLNDSPFLYNPLHDLESIWWVAVYLVFLRPIVEKHSVTNGKTQGERSKKEDDQGEEQCFTAIFTSTHPPVEQRALQLLVDYDRRSDTFTNPGGFLNRIRPGLHKSLISIATDLDKARMYIRNAYISAEAGLYTTGVDFKAVLPIIHKQLAAIFEKIPKGVPKDLEFKPMPTSSVYPTTVTVSSNRGVSLDSKLVPHNIKKHPRDESDGDDEQIYVRGAIQVERMEALCSPTREWARRNSKHARYEAKSD